MESTVDRKIICEAKEALHSYFAARIAVVVPPGIAMIKTSIPLNIESTRSSERTRKIKQGNTTNRIRQ